MEVENVKRRLKRENLNEEQKNALLLDLVNRVEALEIKAAQPAAELPASTEPAAE